MHHTEPKSLQCSFFITDEDIEDVQSGKMLNDNHINSASSLIKMAFKEIEGLQSTLNSQHQNYRFKPAGEGSIQIIYCGDDSKHWVTTCYMGILTLIMCEYVQYLGAIS